MTNKKISAAATKHHKECHKGRDFCPGLFNIPTNNVRYFTISVVTGAVVSILLNLVAIPFWGYRGAAFTLVIVEIIVCVLMSYYARNYLDIIGLL